MAYSVQQVLLPAGQLTTVTLNGSRCGFPTSFSTLLISCWVCLNQVTGEGFSFTNNTTFFSLSVSAPTSLVGLSLKSGIPGIFNGNFSVVPSINGLLAHVLVSVDTATQTVQVYVNDAPCVRTSGGWTGSGNFDLSQLGYMFWDVTGAGSQIPGAGVGDVWAAAPATFFDLSITSNRRKFINADLTPVDLGADGSGPGIAPPIFLHVPTGSTNPNDFATNFGGGGGPWTIQTPPLQFKPAGSCVASIPSPPPAPGSCASMWTPQTIPPYP